MRLLILTQKVSLEDGVLGFMHSWISLFASKFESVTVICLEEGVHSLPGNVRVFSLGKEKGGSKLGYLVNFYRYIWRERREYDSVFVHMNHEYVLLGGLLWRMLGKKIGLWYAHGHVPMGLHPALWLAHLVFTSTTSGFRIKSPKVHVVGQGIDTDFFAPSRTLGIETGAFRLVSVGRLSPVKRYEILFDALLLLKTDVKNWHVTLLGTGDSAYVATLEEHARRLGVLGMIRFVGEVPNNKIAPYLNDADVFVNMSRTGSLDKAGLEAMSMGLPLVTCNEAFRETLGLRAETLMFPVDDSPTLANRLLALEGLSLEARREVGSELRERVRMLHSLPRFIERIQNLYGSAN